MPRLSLTGPDAMTTAAAALDFLRQRKEHFSLPQPFYVSDDYHRLDMQQIFGNSWIFAGLSCETPKVGDWMTVEVGTDNVILVRGHDNIIRAFHNSCRHRGSRICLESHGSSKRLVCPYHQWGYELTGELSRVRYMEGDFDKKDFGLKPVHLRNVAGYLFISFAAEPPEFDSFRRSWEPYVKAVDIENCKVAFTETIVEKANWKLVMENNRECYHCAGSHPELLKTLTEFDNVEDPRMDPGYRALLEKKAADWTALGIPYKNDHHSFRYRAVRLPFLEGALSMTMDGKPASRKLLGKFTDPDLGSARLLSLPNNWNHLLGDSVLAFRVLPRSAGETYLKSLWLVHKDAVEGVDYDVEHLTHVWRQTNAQDAKLASDNQLGIASRGYQPGPYSAMIEGGVRDFITWYTGEMQARQTPALAAQ